jgi:hypothetical protein
MLDVAALSRCSGELFVGRCRAVGTIQLDTVSSLPWRAATIQHCQHSGYHADADEEKCAEQRRVHDGGSAPAEGEESTLVPAEEGGVRVAGGEGCGF